MKTGIIMLIGLTITQSGDAVPPAPPANGPAGKVAMAPTEPAAPAAGYMAPLDGHADVPPGGFETGGTGYYEPAGGTGAFADCLFCGPHKTCIPCFWGDFRCHDSTFDMPPHFAYFPAYHGYYYFRPYNWIHILEHQEIVLGLQGDPRAPYFNGQFEAIYAKYDTLEYDDVELGPKLPPLKRSTEKLPDFEKTFRMVQEGDDGGNGTQNGANGMADGENGTEDGEE